MTSEPIVFVVDDDPSLRESLERLFQGNGWRARTFASPSDFLTQPRALAPSCLVLDIALPGMSGLDLQRLVKDRLEMPVIFLACCQDVRVTVQAMKEGAAEFLTKPFHPEVLVSAIRDALEHSAAALERAKVLQGMRESHASLSGREKQVLELVVAGLLNKQVGWELGISEITVKAHRGQVMRKMQADSLASLVKMAAQLGLASQFLPSSAHLPSASAMPIAHGGAAF